ncbi:LuxR C-terminal-related transcriptional regulator [Pantanalinema rosaneae CENA516]|uniref:LuxR C-terminal-related transcriptional regulator n=1 Tax=Pantanalinema rosaneae TaxID=1620701 RepID=UPI003D6F7C06
MTARVLNVSPETASVGSLFVCQAPRSSRSFTASHPDSGKHLVRRHTETPEPSTSSDIPDVNLLWKQLFELLPQGVIVASRYQKPVYWNLKAQYLCQEALNTNFPIAGLPGLVSEVCQQFMREDSAASTGITHEYQTASGRTVRITVRWLELNLGNDRPNGNGRVEHLRPVDSNGEAPYLLIFLEDRDQVLREELRIQQQKYDLTDREAEIWMLLQQEFTYQEIAKRLQISLNTVKTHVKNVYAKKRSCQETESE